MGKQPILGKSGNGPSIRPKAAPCEVRLLPEPAVLPLLSLLAEIESLQELPVPLTLVVLLSKAPTVPTWKDVRPISVAAMIYRVWSRIRTRAKELMAVAAFESDLAAY